MNPEIFAAMQSTAPKACSWGCLYTLALLGRAGTAGRTSQELAEAAGMSQNGLLTCARKLARAGLLSSPSRGGGRRGTMHRYTITPAGLGVLLTPRLAVPTMKPLPLP
jgi:hypothetical protein